MIRVFYNAGDIEDLRTSLRLNLHISVADAIEIECVKEYEYVLKTDREDVLSMLNNHPQFHVMDDYENWFKRTPEYWARLTDELTAKIIVPMAENFAVSGEIG